MRFASSSDVQNRDRSLAADVFTYIALPFGFSWILTIGAIKLGLAEEYLNIGAAGPAVAALILSRRGQSEPVRPSVLSSFLSWRCAGSSSAYTIHGGAVRPRASTHGS
jgi:hypothetical protein